MNKKQRLIFGVSIVAVLLGFLAYSGVDSNRYEVSQAVAKMANLTDKIIVVDGTLVTGTDKWDALSRTLTFRMTDGIATIDVFYQGENIDVPPGYENVEVIVTGQFNGSTFMAIKKPLTKCPSKYEADTKDIVK